MSFSSIVTAALIAGAPAHADQAPVPVAMASQQESVSTDIAPPAVTSPPPAPLASPIPVETQIPADPPPAEATGSAIDPETIIVTARPRPPPGDPLAGVNAKSFEIVQDLDKAFVGPAALAYKEAAPRPVRKGLRNFLGNLREPVVFLNYLLQLKPGKAAETAGRFAINSTVGVAGLFDVAKKRPFNLPRRSNGFANTMGYYGVGPGPFFFLPLVGPTTLRDLIGNGLDTLVLPMAIGKPFNRPVYAVSTYVVGSLDARAEFEEQRQILQTNHDPYAATRDFYLRTRQAEIDALRGRDNDAAAPTTQNRAPEYPRDSDILAVPAPLPSG